MFDADNDLCQDCGKWFPAVESGMSPAVRKVMDRFHRRIAKATINRIKEICDEFDSRADTTGEAIARLELAKAFVEIEDKETKMESALKVIRTWAAFDVKNCGDFGSPVALDRDNVVALCDKALGNKAKNTKEK
ncbi:MAG: hypothetical protein WA151_13925 [Desulfatirhabdiaceae bacterium]